MCQKKHLKLVHFYLIIFEHFYFSIYKGFDLTSAFDSEINRKEKNVFSRYKGAVITRLGYLLVLQYRFLLASCEAYLYTDKRFESLSS